MTELSTGLGVTTIKQTFFTNSRTCKQNDYGGERIKKELPLQSDIKKQVYTLIYLSTRINLFLKSEKTECETWLAALRDC